MFEKMIVSGGGRREHRLSKFFVGSSIAYMLLAGSALAISICVSHPELNGTVTEPKIPFFISSGSGPRTPERGRTATAARQNPYHVASLDTIVNRVRTASPPPVAPPRFDGIDPNPVPGGGPGDGNGLGNSLMPGFGTGSDVADTAPPLPRKPDRAGEPSDRQPQKPRAPLAVSAPVLQGKAVFRKTPDYPALARIVKKEGSVVVEVVISPEGRVESARAVSGDPLLAPTAVAAALEWRFQPTYLGSVPVRVAGAITFIFKLGQ